MTDILSVLADNLLAPTILFFVLGLIAAIARSDLAIPDAAAKVMSIYLLFAIGFKGGASVAAHGLTGQLMAALLAGIVLSFVLPFVAWGLLRVMTRLDPLNAAAVAGHYGSISIVTFVAASSVLEGRGIPAEGFIVAVAAAMEVPAILSALWLASRSGASKGGLNPKVMRDIAGNGSIVLLLGSFLIGGITGDEGLKDIEHFIIAPFTGVLCLFLLDMGLSAGRSLLVSREKLSSGILIFGMAMPLVGSLFGLAAGLLVGLSPGGVFLMMTLAASASYIAVPAAVRVALPDANPGIYLTLSLGITFPFNLTVGLPIYLYLSGAV